MAWKPKPLSCINSPDSRKLTEEAELSLSVDSTNVSMDRSISYELSMEIVHYRPHISSHDTTKAVNVNDVMLCRCCFVWLQKPTMMSSIL